MSADHCPDHVERLDLCPECQGLTVTRMTRLTGVTDVRMDGQAGSLKLNNPVVMYLGPVEPCPNRTALEEGAARDV